MESNNNNNNNDKRKIIFVYLQLIFHYVEHHKLFISHELPLSLLEELFESIWTSECKLAFKFMELNKDLIKSWTTTAERLKLLLLKLCNELLRRLSKGNDPLLRGQILLFIAYVLPISDRSAIKKDVTFNITNETDYETNVEKLRILSNSNSNSNDLITSSTYQSFWKLQEYFSQPTKITSTSNSNDLNQQQQHHQRQIDELFKLFDTTLKIFESNAVGINSISNDKHQTTIDFNYPKYITHPKLFNLQLRDNNFRRHFLVQALILCYYLRDPNSYSAAVASSSSVSNSNPTTTASASATSTTKKQNGNAADINFFNFEVDKERYDAMIKRIMKNLEATLGNGQFFATTMMNILKKEIYWSVWKANGGASFEKQAFTISNFVFSSLKLSRSATTAQPSAVASMVFQNSKLNFHDCFDSIGDIANTRYRNSKEMFQEIIDDMEDKDIEDDDKRKSNSLFQWKTIRLARKFDEDDLREAWMKENGDLEKIALAMLHPTDSNDNLNGIVDGNNDNNNDAGDDDDDDDDDAGDDDDEKLKNNDSNNDISPLIITKEMVDTAEVELKQAKSFENIGLNVEEEEEAMDVVAPDTVTIDTPTRDSSNNDKNLGDDSEQIIFDETQNEVKHHENGNVGEEEGEIPEEGREEENQYQDQDQDIGSNNNNNIDGGLEEGERVENIRKDDEGGEDGEIQFDNSNEEGDDESLMPDKKKLKNDERK